MCDSLNSEGENASNTLNSFVRQPVILKPIFLLIYRGKLSSWISECAESHYSKSGGMASKLRDEGNFKVRNERTDIRGTAEK